MIHEILYASWATAARELMEGVCCEACNNPAEVHILCTRLTGKIVEVLVCHEHMLDPGPLLDW